MQAHRRLKQSPGAGSRRHWRFAGPAAGFTLHGKRGTELVVFCILLSFRGDGGAFDLDLLVGVIVLDFGGLLHAVNYL